MDLVILIFMLVQGITSLVQGRVWMSGTKVCDGTSGRWVGALLVAALPTAFLAEALGMILAPQLDLAWSWVVIAGFVAAVGILMSVTAHRYSPKAKKPTCLRPQERASGSQSEPEFMSPESRLLPDFESSGGFDQPISFSGGFDLPTSL